MKIGESRQETCYKTIDGEIVPYTVTVTEHLIQIGDRSTSSRPRAASRGKMIVAADANICYVEDPPPPTRVQITNSQYPWPEVWHEADTAQRANPNWVHTFDAEGHWVLKGSFKCFPGDEADESPIDKTGQVIVGEEKTTTIHVMKALAIKRVGAWAGDTLPQTADEWDSIEKEDDGEAALDAATYTLYELPPAANLTDWVRYYIERGTKADPKGTWDTEANRRLLWWGPRLHPGSNKIPYYAEYNGLLLSHAANDDFTSDTPDKTANLIIDTNYAPGQCGNRRSVMPVLADPKTRTWKTQSVVSRVDDHSLAIDPLRDDFDEDNRVSPYVKIEALTQNVPTKEVKFWCLSPPAGRQRSFRLTGTWKDKLKVHVIRGKAVEELRYGVVYNLSELHSTQGATSIARGRQASLWIEALKYGDYTFTVKVFDADKSAVKDPDALKAFGRDEVKLKVVKAGITALRGIVANRATPNRPLPQGNDIQPGRTEEMVFVVTARLEGPQTGGEGSELSAWLGAGGVGNEPLKVYRGSVAKNKELPPRNKTDQPVLHLSSMLDQRQPRAVDMHNLAIQEGGHPLVDLSERPLNERQYSFWGFIHGGTFESLFEDPHLNARRRGAEQGMYGEDNEPRYNVLQLFDFDKEIELACEEIMGKNKVGIFTYAGLRASQRLSAKEKTAVQNRAVEGMRRFISLPYNAKMIVNGQQVSATGRYWFELDLRRVGGRGRRRTAAELAGLSQGVQQALRDLNRRVEE